MGQLVQLYYVQGQHDDGVVRQVQELQLGQLDDGVRQPAEIVVRHVQDLEAAETREMIGQVHQTHAPEVELHQSYQVHDGVGERPDVILSG